jgi:predicted GNAT family acetyltransferase
MPSISITRRHDDRTSSGTFDLDADGQPGGSLTYTLTGDSTMIVEFVEVDPALRGQGMGDRLVRAAVEWARANGRQIVPHCSYARLVLTRNAAYRDVLSPRD